MSFFERVRVNFALKTADAACASDRVESRRRRLLKLNVGEAKRRVCVIFNIVCRVEEKRIVENFCSLSSTLDKSRSIRRPIRV